MYQIYSCHIFIDYRYQLMRLLNLLVLKKTQANNSFKHVLNCYFS